MQDVQDRCVTLQVHLTLQETARAAQPMCTRILQGSGKIMQDFAQYISKCARTLQDSCNDTMHMSL